MKNQTIIKWVSALGALAVILGAFGAHLLKTILSSELMESYLTGNRYHLVHTGIILALFGIRKYLSPIWFKRAVYLFISGIILFSGSIYLLSVRETLSTPYLAYLGPVTPIGGVLLISGWISIGFGAIKHK